MKKILSIIGVIGLVATSTTTVIACGNKNISNIPETPAIEKEQIINDFKKEVVDIIVEHEKDILPNKSINDTENKYYKFFEKDKLKAMLNGEEQATKTLENEDLMNFNNDFNNIVDIFAIKEKINKLSTDEYYATILSDLPNGEEVFKNISTPAEVSIKGNKENYSQNSNNFYANVTFRYSYRINYKNISENLETLDLPIYFILSLTTNKDFHSAIEDIQKGIKYKFLEESKDFSYISFEKLDSGNKTPLEDMNTDILDHYNDTSKGFSTEIKRVVDTHYFKDLADNPRLGFSNEENIGQNLKWDVKYRNSDTDNNSLYEYKPNSEKDFEWRKKGGTELSEVLNLLYHHDMNSDNSYEKITKLNEFKDESNSQYNKLDEKFINEIYEFYNEHKIKPELLEKLLDENKKITQIGTIEIHNAIAIIGEDYKHVIPGPFELIVGYLPDKKSERKSYSFKSILAKNIATAIGAFQEIYGMKNGRTIEFIRPLLGVFKDESELWKLWGDWKDENDLRSISKKINLTATPELNEIRNRLLSNSGQKHFKYSFVGEGNEKYEIKKEKIALTLQKPKNQEYNFFFEIDYFKIIINFNFGPEATLPFRVLFYAV